jgi:hypothetical protein
LSNYQFLGAFLLPFSVGVVDSGDSPEIRFVFDFFNDTIKLDYMDKTDAEQKLSAGEIPAYVELPDRFAQDIMNGSNTPFILHGNSELPLQLALTRLLASGGVAFLSASQAGIYATIDQAQAAIYFVTRGYRTGPRRPGMGI